ncbi:four-carbon acid sugar kinase family protein [Brevibacillus ruminantium]|uniref:Four-carbon acid sugar kinase family protein n=1 Tax=Brevibacillus ruminantium TaxID=2950604 RepID=A0ABY4WKY2_9BACL|nr:four-carbon acid sugar kinase family protein [Brevibacillus ruminantium]USG67426.1 four-carbon acid sugar kinase family protein [Brevibacillus ruminantium]
MARIVVIADDLTGANDSGVQFAKKGFHTVSLFHPAEQEGGQAADVWIINAETRSLDPETAYAESKALADAVDLSHFSCVYKKIDSTLRGNVGVEINAMLDSYPFDVVAFIPAYPGNKRITIGGYHLINQVLLEDTEIARDPKSPVKESHLPTLLSVQTGREVSHIDVKAIRRGRDELTAEIRSQHAAGSHLIVFDAADQLDLQRATEALLASGLRILWVGSAGLALALSNEFVNQYEIQPVQSVETAGITAGDLPVFVIAGSVSAITAQQIEELSAHKEFHIVTANPLALLQEETTDLEQKRVEDEILKCIDDKRSPVLVTDSSDSMRQAVLQWMESTGTSGLEVGNAIADHLGALGKRVLGKRGLKGFVLTGGDIAYRTCLHLGVEALQIISEVEEGIPLAVIIGGLADKLPVVTKAGAFGNRFSLLRAVEKIYNTQTIRGGNQA